MAIIVTCECGQQFRAEDADAGTQALCPRCQRMLVIPGRRVADSQPPSLAIARQEANRIGVSRQPVASAEMPMSDLARNQTSPPNTDSQLARQSRLSGFWIGWAIAGGLASLCVVATVVALLWNAARPRSTGVDKHTSGTSESRRDGKGAAPAKKPPGRDRNDFEIDSQFPEQQATGAGQEGFPRAANTKYGLSEAKRRLIFQELVKAIDRFGEEAAKTNEWPRIVAEYKIDGDILERILDEGLDNSGWLLPPTANYTAQTKYNRVEWLRKRNKHQFNLATPRGNAPKLVISPPHSRPQPSVRGPEGQHQVPQEEPRPEPPGLPQPTIVGTIPELEKALADLGNQRVMWVQLTRNKVTAKSLQELQQWTKASGVLWLDTDLAQAFGLPTKDYPSPDPSGHAPVLGGHCLAEGIRPGTEVRFEVSPAGTMVFGELAEVRKLATPILAIGPVAAGKHQRYWIPLAVHEYDGVVVVFRPRKIYSGYGGRGRSDPGAQLESSLRSWSFSFAGSAAEHVNGFETPAVGD
jgi:hypothetical protein